MLYNEKKLDQKAVKNKKTNVRVNQEDRNLLECERVEGEKKNAAKRKNILTVNGVPKKKQKEKKMEKRKKI